MCIVPTAMHGGILRQLRESKGRSQAEVARSAGISPAQLARLESNQRRLYVDDFVRIAKVLGEEPGNLLPNDLGNIGHLKPLIDRLAVIQPQLLAHVAAIVESLVSLTEEAANVRVPPATSEPSGAQPRNGAPDP
jgi:transcriptional regulator with XRE-family HTH domain